MPGRCRGDAGGLALAAGRCCSSLWLDLAEESAVDADIFDGSCHRPDAELILLEWFAEAVAVDEVNGRGLRPGLLPSWRLR
jgi:hypothetical protein